MPLHSTRGAATIASKGGTFPQVHSQMGIHFSVRGKTAYTTNIVAMRLQYNVSNDHGIKPQCPLTPCCTTSPLRRNESGTRPHLRLPRFSSKHFVRMRSIAVDPTSLSRTYVVNFLIVLPNACCLKQILRVFSRMTCMRLDRRVFGIPPDSTLVYLPSPKTSLPRSTLRA
jgi:hypothetical protein